MTAPEDRPANAAEMTMVTDIEYRSNKPPPLMQILHGIDFFRLGEFISEPIRPQKPKAHSEYLRQNGCISVAKMDVRCTCANRMSSWTSGTSFVSAQAGATRFVTMTVIPEPHTVLLGSLGIAVLLRRRR